MPVKSDPLVFDALDGESHRQRAQIELIASENVVSEAVRKALGHEISNKTLEGYPGNRFHGGARYADVLEQAAIDRAKALFECDYANVQPHSGSQANLAVFFALLTPGDRILSLDLAAGGHLSHGASPNLSGRWFEAHHYGVDRESGLVDYDALDKQVAAVRPKLLIAGGSAYPRQLDFERLAHIANKGACPLLVDMAHIAGLVAGGVHPSPLPYADIVTSTTTKTLRGPRGGLILSRGGRWQKRLQSAVFPGTQGSLHTNVIAAKAVCLGEALESDFRRYAERVVENAVMLASTLRNRGVNLVADGTETHLVLIDLGNTGMTGQQLQDALAAVNITSNKNPVPFDAPKPADWRGLRLGTAAATTRGLGTDAFKQIGNLIADNIPGLKNGKRSNVQQQKQLVAALCDSFIT